MGNKLFEDFDKLILEIENDNIEAAKKTFFTIVYDNQEWFIYINRYSRFLLKEADVHFIPMFDENSKEEERNFIKALHDAKYKLENRMILPAQRDLYAIGVYLQKSNTLFINYICSFYTLLFISISNREKENFYIKDGEKELINFIETLKSKYPEDFNNLKEIIFRDFASLINKVSKKRNDNNSVFDNELSPNQPKKNKSVDIDKAIIEFQKELKNLIGLDKVKDEVLRLINFAKINIIKKQNGVKVPNLTKHIVFTGNPGTGKTTVARMLSKIYFELGLLSKGQIIEVDRSQLVGEYIGHTAPKTKKAIEQAKGGILFIDEAYSLAANGETDFGKEAIETLLKYMEDYRDDLIIIVAGYPDKMNDFLKSNPGLNSRFSTKIHFDNYNAEELIEIFSYFISEVDYYVEPKALLKLKKKLDALSKLNDFGNARDVRNIFDETIKNQSNRLSKLDSLKTKDLKSIKAEDIS